MGSLRYIKHRRRSENWQAYKCYRGFIEQLAKARAADSLQNAYKTLDSQNNDEILALFFIGDLREKERKYYEFIKNLVESEGLLPEFSRDSLKCWEEYLNSWTPYGNIYLVQFKCAFLSIVVPPQNYFYMLYSTKHNWL